MKTESKKAKRVAAHVFGTIFFLLGLLGGIGAIADRHEVEGAIGAGVGLLLDMAMIALARRFKDSIRLSLSISGVNHFIPFETSQKEEAEAKCKMLKDAKSEYERIACI